MTTTASTATVGTSPIPVDLTALSVADITDWLETFSGPAGQAQVTDQGSIGLLGLKEEAGQLEQAVQNIVRLIPGSPAALAVLASNGSRPATANTAVPPLLRAVDEIATLLRPPRTGKIDRDAVHGKLLDLLGLVESSSLDTTARIDLARRLAGVSAQLRGFAERHPDSQTVLHEITLLLIHPSVSHPPPTPAAQAFQRVIVEGERSVGSGDNVDLSRVVKRVVSEAFAQSTFLGNNQPGRGSSPSYTSMGSGPVSMYAQDADSIPPAQRAAAAAGLTAQVSTEQAVLQQQFGPAVAAALATLQQIQPLAQTIDYPEFVALRAAVASDLNALLDEAGRADGPRTPRVVLYGDRLARHLAALTEIAGRPVNGAFDSTDEESAGPRCSS